MAIKLFAFDLDGTFLRDDKSVPPENTEALYKAHKRDIILVPATGRLIGNLPVELTDLPFIRYFITINGAAVYDREDKVAIMRAEIPPELSLKILEYAEGLDCYYDAYVDDFGKMPQEMYDCLHEIISEKPVVEMIRRGRDRVDNLLDYMKASGKSAQKLQLYFSDPAERDRQMRLIPEFFPEILASNSMKNNIELNINTAGKGNALKALCSRLGLSLSQCAAIGDNTNDLQMLSAVGMGIAIANAAPSAKSLARIITERDNNSGGFAEAVELVLKESLG